jgi:hypothetical protein
MLPLICPVCGASLAQVDRSLKCPQAHSFDIAREGYVNLLIRHKRPKITGDSKDMLRARRNFLDRGHYTPLSDAINEQVQRYLAAESTESVPTCIAEVGCGEGYYVGRLQRHLDGQLGQRNLRYFGLDISKEAARLAAKRYREVCFFVADAKKKILLAGGSVRVLLNVFAPRNVVEFDRIAAQDGMLLIAIPAPDHLIELRSELGLLDIEANKRQRVVEQLAGAFKLAGEQSIAYEMQLGGQELVDLVQMTPNYWHVARERLDSIKTLERIRTRASFVLIKFYK